MTRLIDADALIAFYEDVQKTTEIEYPVIPVGVIIEHLKDEDVAPTIESSGDLISRADALQCKPEYLNPICNWNEGWNKAINEWYEALKTVPSVSAEALPQGEWIDTEFLKLKECSCCHNRWGVYSIEEFDFCPSCGAKMGVSE